MGFTTELQPRSRSWCQNMLWQDWCFASQIVTELFQTGKKLFFGESNMWEDPKDHDTIAAFAQKVQNLQNLSWIGEVLEF